MTASVIAAPGPCRPESGALQAIDHMATGHHDPRKSIDRLALLATETLGQKFVGPHRLPPFGRQIYYDDAFKRCSSDELSDRSFLLPKKIWQ